MRKNPKILHLSSAVKWRGGENQVYLLYRELESLGIEQMLMMPRGQACDTMEKKGVEPTELKFRQPWLLYDALRISGLCSKKGCNIIHAHDSKAHTTAALAIELFGAPAIMVAHRRVDNPLRKNFITRWKYKLDSLRAIICVSDHIKNSMATSIEQTDKLHTIHSATGILQESSKPTREIIDLRKFLNIPEGAHLVCNVSALDEHKDPIAFLITARITLDKRKDVHFVWIGADAGMEKKCRAYVRENGMEDRVHFTGYIENAARLISQMDVFLFTSRTEGLGTTLLDAMAQNTPVVSTSSGGPEELIDHLQTGWLADVGNPQQLAEGIEFFLSQSEKAGSVAMNARKQVEKNFSPAAMCEKTLILYRSIVSGSEEEK
jgi:L-malate glycosyltransferase